MATKIPSGKCVVMDYYCPQCEREHPKSLGISPHFVVYVSTDRRFVSYYVCCHKHECKPVKNESSVPITTKQGNPILEEISHREFLVPVDDWNAMMDYATG